MEQDWAEALEFVLEMEGEYTNDPNDPGKETKWGISQKSYPNLDIKNLSRHDAEAIYKRDFWTPCRCADLPRAFALLVFDAAVNQGLRVGIRIMQIALNVSVDGIIGPKTLAAAHAAQPRQVRLALAERISAYIRLIAEHPKLIVFSRNWAFRVLSLAGLIWDPRANDPKVKDPRAWDLREDK